MTSCFLTTNINGKRTEKKLIKMMFGGILLDCLDLKDSKLFRKLKTPIPPITKKIIFKLLKLKILPLTFRDFSAISIDLECFSLR